MTPLRRKSLLLAGALALLGLLAGPSPAQDSAGSNAASKAPTKTKDSAEDIAKWLAEQVPPDEKAPPRTVGYRHISWDPDPRSANGTSSEGGATAGKPVAAKKTSIDVTKTRAAYEQHRSVFDQFESDVVQPALQGNQHGAVLKDAIENSPWGDKLIAATIAIQDVYGDLSPKTIKELIRDGVVSKEHAALMWAARDVLVKRTMNQVQTKLHQDFPGFSFKITILDSGSVGSIGSDIDKTLHVQMWDASGKQIEPFGSGGKLGDYGKFLKGVVDVFDGIGSGPPFHAKNSIAKSLDTEFFGSSSLPKQWGSGATIVGGESRIDRGLNALKAQFAVLQENPGPAYQFVGKVIAQVTGRAVEQDVNMADALRDLQLDRAAGNVDSADFLLREMLAEMHSPAVVVTYENGKAAFKQTSVVDFLEENGFYSEYHRAMAAENAAGDYEKLRDKVHTCIGSDGTFHASNYDGYLNDIAKYGGRSTHDTATFVFSDDDPGKPREFGDFDRRFVPDDELSRFGRDVNQADGSTRREAKVTANGRPYTADVHRELYEPALRAKYGDGPAADAKIQRDLGLYWASQRASETALALKADPALLKDWRGDGGYPYDRVLGELLDHLKAHNPALANEPLDVQLRVAKRAHLQAEEGGSLLLTAHHLKDAIKLWMTNPKKEYQRIKRSALDKVMNLHGELRRLAVQIDVADDPSERKRLEQRRNLLDERLEGTKKRLDMLTSDPAKAAAAIRMQGLDTVRRIQFLFDDGSDGPSNPARQMLAQVSAENRRDVEILMHVCRAQADAKQQAALAQSLRIDLTNLPAYTREVAGDLAYGYLDAFGVDAPAFFSSLPGGRTNEANQVIGRFLQNTYLDIGTAAAPANIVRAMQQAEWLPPAARAQALRDAITNEIVSPIPGIGPLYATYTGYRSGDPQAMAGGALQLSQELFQMWLSRVGERLDDAAALAGNASHNAFMNRLAGLGGSASLALDLARTGVELIGHEAFAPIRDENYQIAFKGYVSKQDAGILRSGNREAVRDLVFQPITAAESPAKFRFLFLRKVVAARYLGWLRSKGETRAAQALLWLGNATREANKDGSDAAVSDTIEADVMIDLELDYEDLTRAAENFDIHRAEWPPSLVRIAETSRRGAVERLGGLLDLQRVTRGRIADDHARRGPAEDALDLWLLAARENLAAYLHQRFDDQLQLLYRRLVHDPDAEETLAAEAQQQWKRFASLAESFRTDDSVRKEFLALARPDLVFGKQQEAVKQQMVASGESSWSSPKEMAQRWLDGKLAEWDLITTTELERRQRDARLTQASRRAAAMSVFIANEYMDARTPMDPFRLDQATAWYGREIRKLHAELADLRAESPSDVDPDGTRKAEKMDALRSRTRRLELEHGLLLQGYAEAEAAVAPKLALELVHAWVAGDAPYTEPANAALKFVWYDKQTLDRLRTRIERDIARGRRLLPSLAAQRLAHRYLFPTRMDVVTKAHLRMREHALMSAARDAQGLAQLRAEARERVLPMDGPLTLEAEPYLVIDKDGLAVHVNAKARHDVTRGALVKIEWDKAIVPYDEAERVLGKQRYDEALAAAEMKPDDLLFAVRVRVAVTDVKAAKGYESRLYPKPWPSQTHVLLVSGNRTTEAEPAVEYDPSPLTIRHLRSDTPERFLRADAIDFCAEKPRAIHVTDRIAVFYTPSRDTAPPISQKSFAWRIDYPDGKPTSEDGMETGLPLHGASEANWHPTKDGSPGPFVAIVNLWTSRAMKGDAVAGEYVLKTTGVTLTDAGVYGLGGLGATIDAKNWKEEGRFTVEDHRLHFKGFVREPFTPRPLRPIKYLTESIVRAEQLGSGARVTMKLSASWKKESPINSGREIRTLTGTASQSVTLTFPAELNPNALRWPSVPFSVEQPPDYETLKRNSKSPYYHENIIHGRVRFGRMTATNALPPERSLFEGASAAKSWGPPLTSDGKRTPLRDLSRGYGGSRGSTMPFRDGRAARSAFVAPFGVPERTQSEHLSDPNALFVIPVIIELVDANSWQQKVVSPLARQFGYAVYGASPGPYQGPAPQSKDGDEGSGSADGTGDGATAGNDTGNGTGTGNGAGSGPGTGNGTGSGAGRSPLGPGSGRGPGGRTGTGNGTGAAAGADASPPPTDEAGVNPRNPDQAALIREWLRAAEPPQNADPDVRLRYTPYGQVEGKAKGGTITVNAKPDDVGGRPSEEYAWSRRAELDSLNHCTLGEYVVARLNSRSTSGCGGRYPPGSKPTHTVTPPVVGSRLDRARRTLRAGGLNVRVVTRPASASGTGPGGRVLSQSPAGHAQIRVGQTVTLVVSAALPEVPPKRPSGTGTGGQPTPVVQQPSHRTTPVPKEIRFPDLAGLVPQRRVVKAFDSKDVPLQGDMQKQMPVPALSINSAQTMYGPKGEFPHALVMILWAQPIQVDRTTDGKIRKSPELWPGGRTLVQQGGKVRIRYHADRFVIVIVAGTRAKSDVALVERITKATDKLLDQPAFAAYRFPPRSGDAPPQPTPPDTPTPKKERPKSIRFPKTIGNLRAEAVDGDVDQTSIMGTWGAGVGYIDGGGKTRGYLGVFWFESDSDWAKLGAEHRKARDQSNRGVSIVKPGSPPAYEQDEDGDLGVLVIHEKRLILVMWWGAEGLKGAPSGAARRRLAQVEAAKRALFRQVGELGGIPPKGTFR